VCVFAAEVIIELLSGETGKCANAAHSFILISHECERNSELQGTDLEKQIVQV